MRVFFGILIMIVSFASYGGTYQGGLKIDRMWVDSGKILFGFTTKPADCISLDGSYGVHASISTANPLYKEQYSLLLTAKATDKLVDIWYSDMGDCSTSSELLNINIIGFSIGQ